MNEPFGVRLRAAREARGWSRHQVENFTRKLVSASAVKDLERDANREPHNGTRAALLRLFPELDVNLPQSGGVRMNNPNNLVGAIVMSR